MSGFEYAFFLGLLFVCFPFSLSEMGAALDAEDVERFSLWVFIASMLAGLPLMMSVNLAAL